MKNKITKAISCFLMICMLFTIIPTNLIMAINETSEQTNKQTETEEETSIEEIKVPATEETASTLSTENEEQSTETTSIASDSNATESSDSVNTELDKNEEIEEKELTDEEIQEIMKDPITGKLMSDDFSSEDENNSNEESNELEEIEIEIEKNKEMQEAVEKQIKMLSVARSITGIQAWNNYLAELEAYNAECKRLNDKYDADYKAYQTALNTYNTKVKESTWAVSSINMHIGGYSSGMGLFWGNGNQSIRQLQERGGDGAFWYDTNFTLYTVSYQNGKYVVTNIYTPTSGYSYDRKPPVNGFILLTHKTSSTNTNMKKYLKVGTEVKITFNYKSYANYASSKSGTGNTSRGNVYVDQGVAPKAPTKPTMPEEPQFHGHNKTANNNGLVPISYASTINKVDIDLFDYDKNINARWEKDNKYPGFNNPGTTAHENVSYDANNGNWSVISDLITSDVEGGKYVLNNGGDINKTSGNTPFIAKFDPVLSNKISNSGFPQLKDGTSLSYLFREGEDPAVKKISAPYLDGLFQYDPETYTYHFNSRANFAQYNKQTNKFDLYDALLTPNYTTYIFGNFMPFNDIQKTKRVSDIDRNYMIEMMSSAKYKSEHETDSFKKQQYNKLYKWTTRYIEAADSYFGKTNWSYLETINAVFQGLGFHKDENGVFDPLTNDDFDFSKLYTVDFDDEMNFWFGMSQEVNFYQPEGGMVGKNNAYEMTYKFTGDDDFWLYIDGDLFIDLTGVHRHHGAEINFTKGIITYYETDINNDGDLKPDPVKTVRFSEVVSDPSILNENGTFKDWTEHNLKLFYMERGSGSGVCRMNFNFPVKPTNFEKTGIIFEKEIISESEKAFSGNGLDINDDYEFPITLEKVESIILDEFGNPVKDENGKVKTRPITDGIQIKGKIINNGTNTTSNPNAKFVIEDIDSGVYKVTETQANEFFELVNMQALNEVDGMEIAKREDGNYYLTVNRIDVTEYKTFKVKVTNSIEYEKLFGLNIKKEIVINEEKVAELREKYPETFKDMTDEEISWGYMKLDKNDTFNFQITLKEKTTGNVIKATISNKEGISIKDIPSGSYIIEEADDMYFDFVDMKALNSAEGFSFEKEGLNYVLTIDEKQAENESSITILVKNQIEPEHTYEDKTDKINKFNKS